MFWPLEKVPTTSPLLLIATDCNCPAAKPFWVMVLMVAAPLELANCVSAPLDTLTVRFPSDRPSTLTFGTVIADPVGEDSDPSDAKVKFVPVLTHAFWLPVAAVLVW